MRFIDTLAVVFLSFVASATGYASDAAPTIVSFSDELVLTLSDQTTLKPAYMVPIESVPDSVKHPWIGQPIHFQSAGTNRYGDTLVRMKRLNKALTPYTMAYHFEPTTSALWEITSPAKAIFTSDTASEAMNQWAEVIGQIKSVTVKRNHAYLNFGENWKEDFTIYIPKETLKAMAQESLGLLELKNIRVRGWVHAYYGPRITLHNPQMMEVIDEP